MVGTKVKDTAFSRGEEAAYEDKTVKKKKSVKEIFALTGRNSTKSLVPTAPDRTTATENPLLTSPIAVRPPKNITEMFGRKKLERRWDAVLQEADKDWDAAGGSIRRLPFEDPKMLEEQYALTALQSPTQSSFSGQRSPQSPSFSCTDSNRSPTDTKSLSVPGSPSTTKRKPRRKLKHSVPHSVEAAKLRKSNPTPEPPTLDTTQQPLLARGTRHRGRDSQYKLDSTLPEQCQRISWNPVEDLQKKARSGESFGPTPGQSGGTNYESGYTKSSAPTNITRYTDTFDNAKPTPAIHIANEEAVADDNIVVAESRDSIESVIDRYSHLGDAVSGWHESDGATTTDSSEPTMSGALNGIATGHIERPESPGHVLIAQTNDKPRASLSAAVGQSGVDLDVNPSDSNHTSQPRYSPVFTQKEAIGRAGSDKEVLPQEESNVQSAVNRTSGSYPNGSSTASEALNDQQSNPESSSPFETAPSSPEMSPVSTNFVMIHEDELWHPPPLLAPTATHDEYGFSKASRKTTIDDYNAWYIKHSEHRDRRTGKWIKYLNSNNLETTHPTTFPSPSGKTQRFISKGIPSNWRGEAWFFYAGGQKSIEELHAQYMTLLSLCETAALPSRDREAIERDLHRTFPNNVHFKPLHTATLQDPRSETPIISALRRVLSAFAIAHPTVGYCQSLNFIAGLLLLFLPEERTFWMLRVVTTSILPGSHDKQLEGARIDTWVLTTALEAQAPRVWKKVSADVQSGSSSVPAVTTILSRWLMAMFTCELPVDGVLRIWDIVFYEGPRILFSIALAIFHDAEKELENLHDVTDTLQVVQNLPRKILDVGRLFELASSSCDISNNWIGKKRKERRDFLYRQSREREGRTKSSDQTPMASPTDSSGKKSPETLPSSATRRNFFSMRSKSKVRAPDA